MINSFRKTAATACLFIIFFAGQVFATGQIRNLTVSPATQRPGMNVTVTFEYNRSDWHGIAYYAMLSNTNTVNPYNTAGQSILVSESGMNVLAGSVGDGRKETDNPAITNMWNPSSIIDSNIYMTIPAGWASGTYYAIVVVREYQVYNNLAQGMIHDNYAVVPINVTIGTPTITPSATATPTPLATPTGVHNKGRTEFGDTNSVAFIFGAVSPTITMTQTITQASTQTPTPTITNTTSPTITNTNTPTVTPTISSTNTPTITFTLTPTNTQPQTFTSTATVTATATQTATATVTGTSTQTHTATQTNTPTLLATATDSPTVTQTRTHSPTSTPTHTPTLEATATNSPTITPTQTPADTFTTTATFTVTFTRTATHTITQTATVTPVYTATVTPEQSATFTVTQTATKTATPSATAVLSHTATLTFTPTRTETFTATLTPSQTATSTNTQVNTHTATHTATFTATLTPVPVVGTSTPTPFPPDIKMFLVANASDGVKGSLVTVTLLLKNTGKGIARDVAVTQTLPSEIAFKADGSDSAWAQAGNLISADAGDILPGQTVMLQFVFEILIDESPTGDITIAPAEAAYRRDADTPGTATQFRQSNAYRLTIGELQIFPNPFNIAAGGTMKFYNLPIDAKVIIYTISGEKVMQYAATERSNIAWDGKNTYGSKISPGMYYYVVLDVNEKVLAKDKLFVIKK